MSDEFGFGIVLQWTKGDINKQLEQIQKHIDTQKLNIKINLSQDAIKGLEQLGRTVSSSVNQVGQLSNAMEALGRKTKQAVSFTGTGTPTKAVEEYQLSISELTKVFSEWDKEQQRWVQTGSQQVSNYEKQKQAADKLEASQLRLLQTLEKFKNIPEAQGKIDTAIKGVMGLNLNSSAVDVQNVKNAINDVTLYVAKLKEEKMMMDEIMATQLSLNQSLEKYRMIPELVGNVSQIESRIKDLGDMSNYSKTNVQDIKNQISALKEESSLLASTKKQLQDIDNYQSNMAIKLKELHNLRDLDDNSLQKVANLEERLGNLHANPKLTQDFKELDLLLKEILSDDKIYKQIEAQKQVTLEIERQLALYREQLAIKEKNLKTTYGKHYDSDTMGSIINSANNLNASDFDSVSSLKNTTQQLDLQVEKAKANMRELRRESTLAMKEADSFSTTLMKDFGKMAAWSLVATAMFGPLRALQSGLDTLKELDGLMVDIAKVTNMSADAMERLKSESFDAASNFGRTAQDYLKATAEFSRAGYEGQAAESLSNISLMAQNVGELTADQANSFLLATDAAYKYKGSQEELMKVLDGANQIDNKFATSISKISDGITVAGSIASNAGVGINELSAAVGTMTAVTQKSGNEVGRAFRAIAMNLRQIKGETEDGDIIDDKTISKSASALDGVGIKVHELRNGIEQLRNPMDILRDLSKVWTSLSTIDQSKLIDAIGGKYRGNQLVALVENFDMYDKMLTEYANASGSAMRENEVRMNSWESKVNKLQNTISKFWNESLNTNTIKGMIDGLTMLISTFGNLSTILALVATGFAIFKGAAITNFFKTFSLEAALLNSTLVQTQAELAGLSATEISAMTTTQGLSLAIKGLWTAMKANPIGLVISVITAGILAFDIFNQKQEENAQKAAEISQKLDQEKQALVGLRNEYQGIIKSGDLTSESKSRLKGIQDQLIKTYGLEAEGLDLVNGKYKDQIKIINEALTKKAKEQLASMGTSGEDALKKSKEVSDFNTGVNTSLSSNQVKNAFQDAGFEYNTASWSQKFNGTLKDRVVALREVINELQNLKNKDKDTSLMIKLLTGQYNKYNKELEDNQSILDKYIQNKNVIDFYDQFKGEIGEVSDLLSKSASNPSDTGISGQLNDIHGKMIQLAESKGKLSDFKPFIDELFGTPTQNNLDSAIKETTFSLHDWIQSQQKASEEVSTYNNILDQLSKGQQISANEIADTVAKYEQFSSVLKFHNGVVEIDRVGLENLSKSIVDNGNTAIQNEINKTNATISNLQQRLKSYELEAKAIDQLGKAMTTQQQNADALAEHFGIKNQNKDYSAFNGNIQAQISALQGYASQLSALKAVYSSAGSGKSSGSGGGSSSNNDAEKAAKELADKQKEFLDSVVDAYKEAYEKEKEIAVASIKAQMDAEEKAHQKRIKQLDDELAAYEKAYDAKNKSLEKEESAEDYASSLSKEQKIAQDIQNKINQYSMDTSIEGKAKKAELEKQLADQLEKIQQMQTQRSRDLRKQNLEDEYNKYKDSINAKKKTEDDKYESTKSALEKQIADTEYYYDELIKNEKKYADIRQQIISGNISKIKEELKKFADDFAKINKDKAKEIGISFEELLTLANKVNNALNGNPYPVKSGGGSSGGSSGGSGGSNSTSSGRAKVVNVSSGSHLNVRQSPNGKVIGSLSAGETVQTGQQDGDWIYVTYDTKNGKKSGWANRNYLKSFDTGGFTGSWGSDGKLAMLHEKEMVLNKVDTANLLKVVDLTRNLVGNFKPDFSNFKLPTPVASAGNGDIAIHFNVAEMRATPSEAKNFATMVRNELAKKGIRN